MSRRSLVITFILKQLWGSQEFVKLFQVENVAFLLPDITGLFLDVVDITTSKKPYGPVSIPISESPWII